MRWPGTEFYAFSRRNCIVAPLRLTFDPRVLTMKLAIVATLIAGAAAFAPSTGSVGIVYDHVLSGLNDFLPC